MQTELGNRTALSVSFPATTPAFTTPSKLPEFHPSTLFFQRNRLRMERIYLASLFFHSVQIYNSIRTIRPVTEFSFHWEEKLVAFALITLGR